MSDSVALYIADPSLLRPKLFNRLEGMKRIEAKEAQGAVIGLRFHTDWGILTLNFLPEAAMKEHLEKIAVIGARILKTDPDTGDYFKSRLRYVKMVMGGFAEPGFDEAGEAFRFITRFSTLLNGMAFLSESVVDYDGEVLFGPLKGPAGQTT